MIGLLRAVVVCLWIGAMAEVAHAQAGLSTDGTDFYVAHIPGAVVCSGLEQYTYQVMLISSVYDNNVTVSYFDKQTGKEKAFKNYSVQAGQTLQVRIDPFEMTPKTHQKAENVACHITSKYAISVSYFSTGPMNAGIYQAIPTEALGKKYVISTLPTNPMNGRTDAWTVSCADRNSSGVFVVIGTDSNTEVTITPNGRTVAGNQGVSLGRGADGSLHPFTVTLQRGQCYMVKSDTSDESVDLTGSRVEANKPVAVIAGHEAAFLEYTKGFAGSIDDRDVTIEQMVPVEYWKKTGHISIPQFDSPPSKEGDPGYGELYRIVTADTVARTVNVQTDLGTNALTADPFPSQVANVEHIGIPVNMTSSVPIEVAMFQYKQVSAAFSPPYSAPSQMMIVPKDRWKKRYSFAIPDINSIFYKSYYMSVICRKDQMNKIIIEKNGIKPGTKLGAMSPLKSYTIPGYPDLEGMRLQVSTGSYTIMGDSSFIVYTFGSGAMDGPFHGDLGDLSDGDDWFFCYASAAGQRFVIEGAPKPRIKIEPSCASVTVTATDSAYGIVAYEMMSPYDDLVSKNVVLTSTHTPQPQTVVQYKFKVLDPLKDAVLKFRITTKGGADSIVTWNYAAPTHKISADSLEFMQIAVGSDSCRSIWLKAGTTPFPVDSITFGSRSTLFTYSTAALPRTIQPGDSLQVRICFKAPESLEMIIDTMQIASQCIRPLVALRARSATPLMFAEDVNFGVVTVNNEVCKEITILNPGKADLVVSGWSISKYTYNNGITFPDSSKLPLTVKPGESVKVKVCYSPREVGRDSATITWVSNSLTDYPGVKLTSLLKGQAVKPGISWDRDSDRFSLADALLRFTLSNTETKINYVDSIKIIGPDSVDFSVDPISMPFDLAPEASLEIVVHFAPVEPTRPGVRHATLIAYDFYRINPIVKLTGYPSLGVSTSSTSFSIYPQPLRSRRLFLTGLGEATYSFEVYDLLGTSRVHGKVTPGVGVSSIDLPNLMPGLYYLRVTGADKGAPIPFVVAE